MMLKINSFVDEQHWSGVAKVVVCRSQAHWQISVASIILAYDIPCKEILQKFSWSFPIHVSLCQSSWQRKRSTQNRWALGTSYIILDSRFFGFCAQEKSSGVENMFKDGAREARWNYGF